MKRVILLDDHTVFLESFKIALFNDASFSVVSEASSARVVYGEIEMHKPDLLVADLMLKDTDGIAIARELKRRRLGTRILILTMHSNNVFVKDAFDAGVRGYALKDQPLAEILRAMHLVADGEQYLAPSLGVIPSSNDQRNRNDAMASLTEREREIFCRILDGQPSREIATSLSISIKTVETHRSHINRKLGVRSPAELIRLAAFKGLLEGHSMKSARLAPEPL